MEPGQTHPSLRCFCQDLDWSNMNLYLQLAFHLQQAQGEAEPHEHWFASVERCCGVPDVCSGGCLHRMSLQAQG